MIVGIDLGTTNSAVGVWRDGKAELIPNALGDLLTPSAVSLDDDGQPIVGRAARDRQVSHPNHTATAFKRMIGTNKQIILGGIRLTAEELSSLVLANLKRDAEHHCGEAVTGAVITVPAYFNDRQRKATRRAGELAGLKVERLVNEPTAAALAYGLSDRADREPFLVFDLGGGTFDVSIVEIFDGVIEVRASAGDNRLGGEDFNDAMINLARAKLSLPHPANSSKLREVMRAAAERTRRALSEAASAPITVVWNDQEHSAEIDVADFEEACAPLVERLREPVLRAMRDSQIAAGSMSEIVLVGGATRMPIIRKTVTRMFSRFPNSALNPDHAVALGAAVQAGLKSRDADLAEIRLTDVCPFSLGVAVSNQDRHGQVQEGLFAPIIERNTVLPASRVHRFNTAGHNQTKVLIQIYQGEARLVSANVPLGTLEVDVPPRAAGEVVIDCRFTYDVSGLLEVDVTVPMTDETRQLVIVNGEDAETAERREALAALKVHPRDDEANVALIARAERCFESFIGERRERIGQLIAWFLQELQSQEPRRIAEAVKTATDELDKIEGEQYL